MTLGKSKLLFDATAGDVTVVTGPMPDGIQVSIDRGGNMADVHILVNRSKIKVDADLPVIPLICKGGEWTERMELACAFDDLVDHVASELPN